ncbi:hypothetical protein BJX68DRAFT_38379 [Aspergillus pseudodeflectus]|uniref:Transcription activator of gluconeogenesis acuK n=1 Tax=Aspergillus pseudodeflectus TaxID=176178 RepID=A0ABR4KPT3_9EURO
MQSLILPPASFVAPDFGRLQYFGPERLPLNQPRTANARRSTPRDLPPPSSMSRPSPVEDPLETLRNVRRPVYPELPQPVTTAAVTTAGGTVTSTSISTPGSILSPVSPDSAIGHGSALHHLGTAPGDETLRQPLAYSEPFPSARLPQSLTAQPSSQSLTATYPQPTFGASAAGPASRTLPQKTTRRTKAHVASACVNCKKKHLGCDPARPCRRCVLSNKESTCIDVTHKKRGRPPLKAEEGSVRTYATQMDTRGGLGDQGAQTRRSMHRATSSRELRPMTDLHMHSSQAGPMGVRLTPGQPQRWPIVYSNGIDPALTTQRAMGHRRFSSSGSAQSMTAVSPPGYVPMAAGYNPALAAGRMPAGVGVGRPIPTYPGQGLPHVPSPPQYHQPYGVPISPYPEGTRAVNRIPMGESAVPVPRDPRESMSMAESPVRLPPIYPSPVSNPQPRLNDPYSTWSPSQQHQPPSQMQDPRQQQQQQSGYVEPTSPSNQMRQIAPEMSYLSQLGGSSPSEGHPQQLPGTRTHDERRGSDTEDGDSSRPAKRRKMALNDMVND